MGPVVPFWVVEPSDHAVTGVRVRRSPEGALEILGWWSDPVGPEQDPLKAAVRSVHRRHLREHGIHLVLPGRGAACRSNRLAPDDAELSAGELERELGDFVPYEGGEAVLRWRRLGPPGVLDHRVAAERKEVLAAVESAFEDAGCRFLGISLAPAALLEAREALLPAAARGHVVEVRGAWTMVNSFEGRLSVRQPVPTGLFAVREAYARAAPGASFEEAAAGRGGEAAERALAAALAPLAEDVRRCIEFRRAAVRGTEPEVLLLAGAGMEAPALRTALAAALPAPLALPAAAGTPPLLRPGPDVSPEALAAALPALLAPVGAALGAAGLVDRDLDFRNLPEDLPAAPERTWLPVAAALLVAALGGSLLLTAANARALEVASSPPAPAEDGPGHLSPEDTAARIAELRRRAAGVRVRGAYRRALAAAVAAFPPAEHRGPEWSAEGMQVLPEGSGWRIRLTLRFPGPSRPEAAAERERLAPLLAPFERAGWKVTEARAGTATLERTDAPEEGR